MALIVEDGSQVSGADSYVSLAEADIYIENRHAKQEWENAQDDHKEHSLRLATEYVDNNFTFIGEIVNSGQPLLWPRSAGCDHEGRTIDSDEIPQTLKNAVCHLAHEYAVNGDLNASFSRETSSEQVGSLKVSYFKGKNTRTFPEVNAMMMHIIFAGNKLKRS